MRNAFADALTKAALTDKRVVLLSGDIGNKLFDPLKAMAPRHVYNCGVAEANMTGMAAGLAMMGLRPFTYTITPFATVRCLEQIRVDICYHHLPVTIVGTGAGLSYAELGPTHHSCDDIGLLKMLPNLSIICPCDAAEVQCAVEAALKQQGPVYIRLGKKGEPRIHQHTPDFCIGRSLTVRAGSEICLLSTGNMMSLALEVAERLQAQGSSTQVESFHTIKPLDESSLLHFFSHFRLVATLEEHSLIGGLGSSVAEWLADHGHTKAAFIRFGTRDEFLPLIGSQSYAREYFGLTAEKISAQILDRYKRGLHDGD